MSNALVLAMEAGSDNAVDQKHGVQRTWPSSRDFVSEDGICPDTGIELRHIGSPFLWRSRGNTHHISQSRACQSGLWLIPKLDLE